jgi:hypothetical protein
MQTNSKKVLEALPEFERFMELAQEIKKLSLDKMITENGIKSIEATNFRKVMEDPDFFVDGKRMSVSYYENSYKFDGINNNLRKLRNQLAEIQSELDSKKNEFEVYRQMHDLFKTLVYQERVNT